MSAHDAVPSWVHALARLCLRAYPASFRREHDAAFGEAVMHRWLRERRRASRIVAGVRTARMLVVDTFRAVVPAHMASRRESRVGGRRRKHRLLAWLGGATAGTVMDARVAMRSLAKRPGFTALVVLTLGLGIGANAAIFGALDRIVLRPLPYPDGDRMVYIADHHPQLDWNVSPSHEAISQWRASARTLEWIETFTPENAVWTSERAAEVLDVTAVSAGLPTALGVRAVGGRIPLASDLEPSDPPVVMLAEGFWRREFGGDAGVVGHMLTLNDTMFTIAGIWPAAARLELGRVPDLWRVTAPHVTPDDDNWTLVLALVREGATVSDVESELRALAVPAEERRKGFVPIVNAPYWAFGQAYVQGLWLVFGGVTILMLVALANTANLLLNRTVSRAGELGVRAAVGGSAAALMRLFLMESLALTLLGVATALLVAKTGGAALASLVVERLAALQGTSAGPRALAYGAMLAAGAAFICVLVPAAQLRSLDVRGLLGRGEAGRSGGGRSGWARQVLVAVQVGLAVVLVTGSALTLRSFQKLTSVDVGMDVDRLVQFAVRLPEPRYATAEARTAFWDRVLDAIESLPGVDGVTTSSSWLMSYSSYGGTAYLEGEPRPVEEGAFTLGIGVRPGFFSVTGLRLIEGRDFDRSDDEGVIIVNRAFARRYGDGVVGRRLVLGGDSFYRIIGVADDVMNGSQRATPDRLQFYRPSFELDDSSERFILRTSGDPATVLSAARARIAELDPDLPLRDVTTGTQELRDDTARQRFVAQLLAVFGSLALVLAVTGVYGVVALDVSRRTREVGIRVALGAGARRVARDVVAAGLRPVVFGIAAGALASVWAVRYIEGILYRISATDPLSIAAGIGLLLAAAMAACAIPARRASRVDPIQALRSE